MKASEAEKNITDVSISKKQTTEVKKPEPLTKLYVSNLPLFLVEKDISMLFECFGEIQSVSLEKNVKGKTFNF